MNQSDETSTKLYILLTLIFLICYIVLTAMLEHISSPSSYNTLVDMNQFRVNWTKC
jgi:preprotein translocase subunit SecG